MVYRARKRLC